ncbi:putative quinol monooxygenase [Novosphingobium hassiacum]|uniref:putative quinol monooxygenase n=1 Tax=Novosphingobium hassiacum TaxID=173676 RepID=UPI0024836D52|nr:putative quinol monooxygenase [Novosphingobium hassiacum]
MIVLHVTLEFAPEDVDAYNTGLAELAALTHAEEGCIEYGFARDLLNPNLIQVTECWESKEALELHKQTDHFRNFIANMRPLVQMTFRGYQAQVDQSLIDQSLVGRPSPDLAGSACES